ncbi:hypothetical protein F4802DRAFT_150382 [Xylaria palmicola]|nr:hypothetical protein F4802DRAFT_150382 [Xylaria palmicola]
MRGLLKAAALLAPVLGLALAATPDVVFDDEDVVSRSLITLDLGPYSDSSAPRQTTLDLHVFESATPCGYGNVTLNGEPLVQDDLGYGSGSITTDDGSILAADWKFTCVHLEGDTKARLLSVYVVSVNNHKVDDVAFSVQFKQTAPVTISYIDGATARSESLPSPNSTDGPRPSLEDELAELEILKKELLVLENSIALKITHISEAFNVGDAEGMLRLADCGSLKCFFSTAYNRMKAMTSNLYHGHQQDQGLPSNRLGNPHWPSNHGSQHPLAEINVTKNVSSILSPQEIEQVSSHAKAEDPIPVADEVNDRLQLNSMSIEKPYRVVHIVALVAVVLAILINLAIMVLIFQCVRLLRQRRQARWEKRRRQLRESRDACNALVASKYLNLIQWLRGNLEHESVEDEEKIPVTQQVPLHQRSQAERERRRKQLRESRDACNALVATKYVNLIQWVRGDPQRESVEDQEKNAVMQQVHETDSDEGSSDTLSITMEEEIAQFRAAASVVGNLVTAEGGRGRARLLEHLPPTRPRRASTPSSILSSCPTYRSVDESLPAYDDNCSPEYVVDGFHYTPSGSAAGTSPPRSLSPRNSTSDEGSRKCSSLDENVGK